MPPAALRFTVKEFAPGPLIVISVDRLGSAVARLIVQTPPRQPGSPPGMLKLIVFGSLNKFAAFIASRREQCEVRHDPLSTSSVVLTVSVGSASVQSENELMPFTVAKWFVVSSVLGVNCVKPALYLKIL